MTERQVHGSYRISRKAHLSDALWLEPREFSKWEAWQYLIANAAFKAHRVTTREAVHTERRIIARGSLVRSQRKLADDWGWTRSRVRSFLAWCEDAERIATERVIGGLLIRLTNYELYQDSAAVTVGDPPTQDATDRPHNRPHKASNDATIAGSIAHTTAHTSAGEPPIENEGEQLLEGSVSSLRSDTTPSPDEPVVEADGIPTPRRPADTKAGSDHNLKPAKNGSYGPSEIVYLLREFVWKGEQPPAFGENVSIGSEVRHWRTLAKRWGGDGIVHECLRHARRTRNERLRKLATKPFNLRLLCTKPEIVRDLKNDARKHYQSKAPNMSIGALLREAADAAA